MTVQSDPDSPSVSPGSPEKTSWVRLVLGLAVVFGLFHGAAAALESDRGQAGMLVGCLVVAATLVVERVLFRQSFAAAARSLGLGPPVARGLLAAAGTCLLLLLVIPGFVRLTGTRVAFYPGWDWLVPGLFMQAGVAEEVLFRGYLFGRVRRGRSFWRAAAWAAVPFVAVHLLMFATMPWPIALAAVLLAVVISFPMAHLFELGGRTIWGPALLHFVIQGAVKVIVLSEGAAAVFPLAWMAASATIPFLVFLVPPSAESEYR